MSTLVHLPDYDFIKSYLAIRFGDFRKNYLLYITCFNLSKLNRTIERRIVRNIKNSEFIEDTFKLIEEIGGRSEKILRLGTLLEAFENLDQSTYKQQIIDVFVLQMFTVEFNKKKKYRSEYEVYIKFKEKYLESDEIASLGKNINELFFSALLFSYVKLAIYKLEETTRLLPLLELTQISKLREKLEYSIEDFHLTN